MNNSKHKTKIKPRIPLFALIMPIIVGIAFITLGIIFIIPNFGVFGYVWLVLSIIIIITPIIRIIQVNHKLGKQFNNKNINISSQNVATGFTNNFDDNASRLKEIESLYNNGLINKEEYENKRKDIIDKI